MMKFKLYLYILFTAVLFSCSKSESVSTGQVNSSGSGTAGSLARFAIVGDYLYTVTTTNAKIFDVQDPANPIFKADTPFGVAIETIFPLGNTLFLGSQNGMYIYDISNPLLPVRQSLYTHITSCDPVVANDKFAYVTLSSGQNVCNRGLNQLEVIDISNKKQPKLLQTVAMAKPQGLALSGNDLFVCDDKVKWFDTSTSPLITPKGIINIKAHDAIITGKILMLVGESGLSQYDFSGAEPKLLSIIRTGS
ncbi:MAG: hypothetical protein EOO47_20700 [Flavobacterium sp.]|nr:MAG: hypothetical protein EOO47_20700 [Flavobacterium sp.]